MTYEFITDFREVDNALANSIRGLVVNGVEVPVSMSFPDPDSDGREPTMFVLTRLNEYLDTRRWENDDILTVDETTSTFTRRKPPEPWNCIYSVQLLAPNHTTRNQMQMHLMRGIMSRGSFVSIKGQNYHVDTNDVWSGQMVSLLRDVEKPITGGEREITAAYALTAKVLIDVDTVGVTSPIAQGISVDGDPNL